MDTALLSKHAASHRQAMPFDDWTNRLQSICGRYHPQRHEQRSTVKGYVGVMAAGGIDVADKISERLAKSLNAVQPHVSELL